jgi:hypothetical protein
MGVHFCNKHFLSLHNFIEKYKYKLIHAQTEKY